MSAVKPMEIDDYIAEVYITACDEMNNIIEKKSNNVTFEECYRLLQNNIVSWSDLEDIFILVAKLIWNDGFKQDFYKLMGYVIDTDNPHAFDASIRLYCLKIMELDLRDEFMVSTDFLLPIMEG